MLRTFLKVFILVFIWSLLVPSSGVSQTRRELITALERLNRDIERVKELVLSFNNDRAIEFVKKAQKLRDEAVSALQKREIVVAAAKIKLANSLLEQAVRITLEGPIHRLRSRLEELMRQADNLVLGSHHKEAERILREAKANQEAAKKAFARKKINQAVEHYRVAIALTQRAMKLVKKSVVSVKDRFLEQRQKFELLLIRAREVVEKSHNRRAKQIFDQARKLASSAEEAFRNRNFELARKLYNQSVLLLLRAMDLASGEAPAVADRANIAFDRLTNLIEDSREVIANSKRPRAQKLFERAIRVKREAELAVKEGRRYEALWKVELAENLIQQAHRIAGGRITSRFSTKISQEIENTKNDIAEFQRVVAKDAPKDVIVLLNMAKFVINRAERAYAAGFNRLALENVLAAQRFLTKAERIVRYQEPSTLSKERIALRLNQLNEAIDEAEKKVVEDNQKWNRQLIKSAKDIRRIAVESFQAGNYQASDEAIQVAFEILRKSLKKLPEN
jgi:tetratricopeptide (TPR) repeat protein